MSLSVCIMTSDPPPRAAAILTLLREVADDIVVAVDSRLATDQLGAFADLADTLVRYEFALPHERAVAWLHSLCAAEWILRIDGDEVPSADLLAALPELTSQRDVLQYWLPRRWLVDAPYLWLDEVPWHPDHQLRLVRNDPATLWFPGLLHSGPAPLRPGRYVEAPLYHLDCLIKSVEARAAKADEYEALRPGLSTPGGYPTNAMYLPERYSERPRALVPDADRPLIDAVLNAPLDTTYPPAPDLPVVGREVIDTTWSDWTAAPDGNLGEDFYRARVEPIEHDDRMRAGERRFLHVRVTNEGDRPFPGGIANRPQILASYRWRSDAETAEVYAEGLRSPLPVTLAPGASTIVPVDVVAPATPGSWVLEFDLLHEFVRWFHADGRMTIDVRPADPTMSAGPVAPPREIVRALPGGAVAAVFAPADPHRFLATIRSLRASEPQVPVVVGAPDPRGLGELVAAGATAVQAHSLAHLVSSTLAERGCPVLAVGAPVLLPPNALGPALAICAADPRVATVSFLSNAAGSLSFPYRNGPTHHQVDDLDERSITRALRLIGPTLPDVGITLPAGGAVLFSPAPFSALGSVEEVPGGRLELTAAHHALRARRRGFRNVLDSATYLSRPYDLPASPPHSWLTDDERSWLLDQHPFAAPAIEEEAGWTASPLGVAHTTARTKVLGIRVAIDGTCLGPKEMGTQIQVLALIRALSAHSSVASIAVGLATDVPSYAAGTLGLPKVVARFCPGGDFTALAPADVLHRPFQTDRQLDLHGWRKVAERTLVTLQDVVAYDNGSYHEGGAGWTRYREAMRDAARNVDGLVVISHDVRQQIAVQQLPVETDRVFVIENGTDHLSGDEPARLPAELERRGFVAGAFLLVLGVNYAHKNRDLALRAFRLLRERGHALSLVLVGAAVPQGSSRVDESRVWTASDVYAVPDVSSEERNWLLRHARAVLYPTSAEGFGLVPYEAARFGTPTVLVPFGPLRETSGGLPVTAAEWSPSALADATEALLADPALAQAQIDAALDAGIRYTWGRTADGLVAAYRALLARPPR